VTAQIEDVFCYRGREYAVAGTSEGEPFNPVLFGLRPAALWTLCWRGYQAVFGIVESRLVLDTLHVNLVPPGVNLVLPGEGYRRQEGPAINGVAPHYLKGDLLFNNTYEGVNYHLEYTGGFLLAEGFIDDLYEHAGFQAAWKYERVVELLFDAGLLQQEFDRSEQIKEARRKILELWDEKGSGGSPSADEIARLVGGAFARSYNV